MFRPNGQRSSLVVFFHKVPWLSDKFNFSRCASNQSIDQSTVLTLNSAVAHFDNASRGGLAEVTTQVSLAKGHTGSRDPFGK